MPTFNVSCICGFTNAKINLQSNDYKLSIVCTKCNELLLNKQTRECVSEIIEKENKFKPAKQPDLDPKELEENKKNLDPKKNYFEQFLIEKKLGEGGMAAVYRAVDKETQTKVALKIFKKIDDEKSLQYVIREATILSKLQHPNIVSFKKAGRHQKFPYIVMEYINGVSLEELVEKGPLEPKHAVQIMLYVIEAMIYASQFQLIHRDIKPANILMSQQGIVKLIDVGVGKILAESGITKTGDVVGTCFYMPPEQLHDSKNVDFRVDMYAIGATLYHLLCGSPPYWEYENLNKLIFAKLGNNYISLHKQNPTLPKIVLDIVDKAMKHKAQDRYKTLFEMKQEWMIVYQKLTSRRN